MITVKTQRAEAEIVVELSFGFVTVMMMLPLAAPR